MGFLKEITQKGLIRRTSISNTTYDNTDDGETVRNIYDENKNKDASKNKNANKNMNDSKDKQGNYLCRCHWDLC